MAAAVRRIRVLLATADPQVSQAVEAVLDQAGLGYMLRSSSSREEVLSRLRSQHPEVILVAGAGIPDLSLGEILGVVRKIGPGRPVVVLGKARTGRSKGRSMSRRSALGITYWRLEGVERLPFVIERALREQQARNSQSRLRTEIDRAARLIARNQKLATIGQLTGSIAHEINNPLEAVTNLLYLLERGELSPSGREYLAVAQRELDRVVRISKQTLNFYRESTTPVRVGLGALLDEVLVLYSRRIAQKQIEVVRQFLDDEPLLIFPGEMRQVFSNVVSNAIEASREHGRLYLRLRKSHLWGDPQVTGMRVTIADQGAGIPARMRRHVGEPFFTTKGETGTGLGLWVSQSIIRNYGGNLLFRSNTGEHHGTVFTLLLPTSLRPRVVARTAETARAAAFLVGRSGGDRGEQKAGEPRAPGSRPLAS